MLIVSELNIYPVKSLGGIPVQSARVTDRGLQYDRRWMLVDENNQFLTQRNFAKMALLKTGIFEDKLVIENSQGSNAPLLIPLHIDPENSNTQHVQVWSDRCKAVHVSLDADEWLSDALSVKCRLVYMPDSTRRRVDGRYAQNKEITNFSDGYPFMMIGQASLDDLNNRLAAPLPMNRFRPNIVFTGGSPYQEDLMEHFSINGIGFLGVKRCGRCIVTTIDQQNAVAGKEPLTTLATYRKKNNKIYFGQNLLGAGEGLIKVGDTINVINGELGEIR